MYGTPVMYSTAVSLVINKMKKLVKIMKHVKMIKLVIMMLSSVLRSRENYSQS